MPEDTTVQVPRAPARLHRSQLPAHAVLQHTPSTQLPEAHCVPEVQPEPPPNRSVQLPPLQ